MKPLLLPNRLELQLLIRHTTGQLRTPRGGRGQLRAAMEFRPHHRRGARGTHRRRHRAADGRQRAAAAHLAGSAGPVPVLRIASDPTRQRVRSDAVPHGPSLHGVPPAVRSHQARLIGEMGIETVGVVGAGTMGSGIAQLALQAGHTVLLFDADPAAVTRGRERIREGLGRRASRLDLDAAAMDGWVEERLGRCRPVATAHDLAAASDLVIEAVIEDLAAKQALFRAFDGGARPDTILSQETCRPVASTVLSGVTAIPDWKGLAQIETAENEASSTHLAFGSPQPRER